MAGIQEKIGYSFRDETLLQTALTHSSFSRDRGNETTAHNERLEYLGDAFLDAIIGEELYRIFPDREEGFLTRTRASLVCEKSLVERAHEIGLGDYLRLGHGEEKTGGRNRDSILADAVEAVIGAVFLDGGYDAVKRMVLVLFEKAIKDAQEGRLVVTDYKTRLQEILQAEGILTDKVKYVDAGQKGPDHDKVFTVRLEINGVAEAEGTGKSKKQAQQNAAEAALKRRGNVI
ncbi:MAG: ribonuclease III [Bacillota bacterium]|nr:ribonuclease III [Bacillota bacterium]